MNRVSALFTGLSLCLAALLISSNAGADDEFMQLNPGHNGNWWGGADRNGEGGQFEMADNGAGGLVFVATIYSY